MPTNLPPPSPWSGKLIPSLQVQSQPNKLDLFITLCYACWHNARLAIAGQWCCFIPFAQCAINANFGTLSVRKDYQIDLTFFPPGPK